MQSVDEAAVEILVSVGCMQFATILVSLSEYMPPADKFMRFHLKNISKV